MKYTISKCVRLAAAAYNSEGVYTCDNEAYSISKDGGVIYIAFRGSDDLEDWAENFSIKPVNLNGVQVHSGFYKAMTQCLPGIRRYLLRHYTIGDNIVITGHSKGAAMGLLLSMQLAFSGYPTDDMHFIGFACPRVIKDGNLKHFNKHRAPITLCEIASDPVTNLPPDAFGYIKVYDSLKTRGVIWWRKIWGVRAFNHTISEYVRKFRVKERTDFFKFKSIRRRLGIRG